MLVRPDGGCYLLDEFGALVWERCDATNTLGEVITAFAEHFEMGVPRAAGEVREWLAELRVEGLLEEPG